jgi:hypothetical protein
VTVEGYCDKEGIRVTLSNAWAQNPEGENQSRLGADYDARFVRPDGRRIIAAGWREPF